jgi:hypothetical protein
MDSAAGKGYLHPIKPMKKLLLFPWPVLVGLMVWGATGCSNREVDTAKLQAAFQSSDPGIRAELDKGIAALTVSNYSAALGPLNKVAYAAKLTKDQRLILEDSIKKVKAKMQ